MLEKHWMGHQVDRSICAWFWKQAHPSERQETIQVPTVVAAPTYYVLHIVREGITFLACAKTEMPPLLGIEFLGRVADVLTEYLGGLNEDLVKDNFVIIYQLLDEMMDHGFPLTTEPSILKEMILPANLVSRVISVVTGTSTTLSSTLPSTTSSSVPWRASGIKHAKNEVYFDLVEEMDATVNKDGFLARCEVYGEVLGSSRLSGMPDVSLTFTNPSILNDVSFHPCVRIQAWESNQKLSFVPPDGSFKLMSYRIKNLKNTPIYVRPQFSSGGGVVTVTVMVGIRANVGKPVDNITLQLVLPPSVASSDLTANHGSVLPNHTTKVTTWTIGRIPKDKAPCLSGKLQLEAGLERLREYPTFLVGFKIMGVALSGLRSDRVDINRVDYSAYRGFRAVTRAGNYEIRS
ncbi:AP-3 complex subunit mu isoform X2 [Physcomitrium patens]|nr:AP-3 complex subunit mu-like isoform X2 [Physcomitrium patens]|eukprot:XP_024379655.1 AP-3 complex subunit mu-like isoform X2 [Physcomitrella patens]